MNHEITIAQAVSTITGNWWWLLPCVFSSAIALTWPVSGLLRSVYSYVFQKEAPFNLLSWVNSRVDLFDVVNSNSFYGTEGKIVWVIGTGGVGGILLSVSSFLLHIAPPVVLWACATSFGFMFVCRQVVSAINKAQAVLKALNIHKKDQNAHKGGEE